MQGIYRIRNLVNGKIYIGSTLNFANRRAVHFSCLRNNKHENPYLQSAFSKHGEKCFVFEIVQATEGLTPSELLEIEQSYLDATQSYDREFGYNINPLAILPPRNIEGCRLGGSRGGTRVGKANVKNGTLKKATTTALLWKQRNPEKVKAISTEASLKAKAYWDANPEERAAQLSRAQAAAAIAVSKRWILSDPDGNKLEVVNLKRFCEEQNLSYASMRQVANGGAKQHKGWRCNRAS